MLRKTTLMLTGLVLATGLVACSNSLESTGTLPRSTESSASASASPVTTSVPETTPAMPSPSTTSATPVATYRPIDSVKQYGASDKAGGEIPADAVNKAQFVSPSGNIVCMLDFPDVPLCTVINPGKSIVFESYYNKNVEIKDSSGGALADAADELDVAPYGSVYRMGTMACAIEEAGVTCWNANTGHGAFMSREHTQAF